MHTEILDEPFRVTLFGYGGAIGSDGIGATGKRYMDNMWREVRERGIKTKGINYWIYLPNSAIFTGVELAEPTAEHGTLEKMDVALDRYLRHVHMGDYSTLPQIWPLLFAQLKERKEIPKYPNLEIYGHWNADPSKCETTIVIGLDQQQ
jgi:hypothetical protein